MNKMTLPRRSLVLLWFGFLVALPPATVMRGQSEKQEAKRGPLLVSVCEITAKPWKYNNKMLRIRGSVRINFEYSTLEDQDCSDGIWLVLGDGTGLPGPAMTVGEHDVRTLNSPRKPARIPIHLKRDANYNVLARYLQLDAKGAACVDHTSLSELPDCRRYRITATFVGRIDGISRPPKSGKGARSPQGFGQMGLFRAQLVVESVSEVSAEEIKH